MGIRIFEHGVLRPAGKRSRKAGASLGGGMTLFLAVVVLALAWGWPTLSQGAGFALIQQGTANLVFPPSITFGVSVSRFQPWTFNFDATWTGWSTYKTLTLKLDQPVIVNGQFATSIVTEKNWHDAWALRFGVNYRLNEKMKIRAGYTFDMTPVPDSTLEPQVPDANRHIFAVGSELKIWRLTLAFAYNFILNESRDKDNLIGTNGVPLPQPAQVNGTYRSNTHSLGLSTTFHF